MAWLTGWTYRKSVTITGSSGAGTDYQVLLKVGESSASPNDQFHVVSHAESFPTGKNDGGDLRFTDNDGETLLSHWVEKIEGTSPNRTAHIWVKVTDDLDSNQSIYCYYGNNGASSVSNGGNTFTFFDDFADINDWTASRSTPNAPAQATYDGRNCAFFDGNGSTTDCGMRQTGITIPANHSVEMYMYRQAGGGIHRQRSLVVSDLSYDGSGNEDGYFYDDYTLGTGGGGNRHRISRASNGSWNWGVVSDNNAYSEDAWVRWKVQKDTGSIHFFDGDNDLGYTDGSPHSTFGAIDLIMTNAGNDTYVDWIFARKFESTEPAYSSAGGEESSGVSATFPGYLFNKGGWF